MIENNLLRYTQYTFCKIPEKCCARQCFCHVFRRRVTCRVGIADTDSVVFDFQCLIIKSKDQ